AGADGACAPTRPGRRGSPRRRIRWAGSSSLLQAVEPVALGTVAGPIDLGELDPARAGGRRGGVALLLRRALDEQQRTGSGSCGIEGLRADAAMVVERRGLRYAERALGDAARARRQLALELQRDAAVALLIVDPG